MKKILLALSVIIILTGCSQTKYDTSYFDIFDTFSTFTCYSDSKEDFDEISEELHSYMTELNKKLDIYNSYDGINNLKTINDNGGIKAVKVDKDIIELIKYGKQAYNMTDGTINIAMGSVLEIWHKYRDNAVNNGISEIPSQEELNAANEHTDINNIVIDEESSTVFIKDSYTKIDVGAIAKGYCADKARDFLASKGVSAALLNLGGNIIALNDSNKEYWKIGVQDPDNENEFITKYDLVNQSAVTSGNYQRYYEYEGKKYHHIIDGNTLMPADNNRSVTVIGESSVINDILSTALFIMPYDEGVKLAEKYNVEVVWVTNNGEIKYGKEE